MQITFLFFSGALAALVLRLFVWRSSKRVQILEREVETYKAILDTAPDVIWCEDNGRITWQNKTALETFRLSGKLGQKAFEKRPSRAVSPDSERVRLVAHQTEEQKEFVLWRERVNGQQVFYASNADKLAETEKELQRFIQTLTETFAHLPIGIAVLDRKRDLVLFNPALADLLDLPAEWLAKRPSLMSFLDRLRLDRTMPEPKDFASLRATLSDLETVSSSGYYDDEWTLSTGQIYKVSGRPHGKGGVVLLFEDKTKSVNVEREYRSELERLFGAFDTLNEAVALFDHFGELVFVNEAFDEMWTSELVQSVTPVTALDVGRMLQKKSRPSPVWGDFRDFIHDKRDRAQWQAEVTNNDGVLIAMTVSPVAGGQVFCEFKTVQSVSLSDESMFVSIP